VSDPFSGFIGQQRALKSLTDQLDQNTATPTPLLICGPAGSGRRPAARQLLDAWRADGEPLWDLSERQLVMNPKAGEKEDDPQFAIGALRKQLSRQATARRAVLLNLAGAGVEAQNALLKTFEEPPSDTWLVALAESPSAVLTTLRSRCHRVSFVALGEEDLAQIADRERWAAGPAQITRACGSARRLQWLADHPEVDEALAADAAGALVQALYASEDRADFVAAILPAWVAAHPARLLACQQAQQALLDGARPETALAFASLS
jgi:hypothetical protein